MIRLLLAGLVALVALTLVGVASAERPFPWAGGNSTVTEAETKFAGIAARLIGYQPQIHCNGETDWAALGKPSWVLGYVPLYANSDTGWAWRSHGYAHLSPRTCWHLDAYWIANPKPPKTCQVGTVVEHRIVQRVKTKKVWVKRRVRLKGLWKVKRVRVAKRVRVPVEVAVTIPVMGACPGYREFALAMHTLAHESMHLRHIFDESVAECHGLQIAASVSVDLGASVPDARDIASTAWEMYQETPPYSGYFSPECRDGGALDLFPTNPAWPSVWP